MMAFRSNTTGQRIGTGFVGGGGATGGSPFSHSQIMRLMKTEFARGRRYGFPVSCLLIQVDRLQVLSDMHGADLKDIVRSQLSQMVDDMTRGADHLGLVTDDRLLAVLPHTDEDAATLVAERIREQFGRLEVIIGGQELAMSVSLGVATCADRETLFFDTMLARAEVALEWAAEASGDKVSVFRKERFVDQPDDADETAKSDDAGDDAGPTPAATDDRSRRAEDRP